MLIISVKDYKNNRWKRSTKTKTKTKTRGMETTVKGWKIIDFAERLN